MTCGLIFHCWLRIHYVPRKSLFVPEDEEFVRGLADGRLTLKVDVDGNATWPEDTWRAAGAGPVNFAFTGGTRLEKPDFPLEAEPESPGDLLAQRPRPTDMERQEHSLTHLPFRSWCPVWVQAKSRQNRLCP